MATKLQPGYWKAGQETGSVLLVEGDKLIFKSLFAFDYPDIQVCKMHTAIDIVSAFLFVISKSTGQVRLQG